MYSIINLALTFFSLYVFRRIQPENAKEFYWQLEFDIFEALEQDNNRIEYAKLDTKLVPVLISFEA